MSRPGDPDSGPNPSASPGPIRGRGTHDDPANRFDALHLEPDGDALDELAVLGESASAPETRFYRDASRSVLAHNESPDVGFDTSLNPYRGCEHGCVYCLGPETPVLHADLIWRPLGEVSVGDVLVGFDEHPPPGGKRKLRPAVVEAVWWSRKPTLRLITPRAEVVATAEHRWLSGRQDRWLPTERLSAGSRLRLLPLGSPEAIEAVERAPRRDVVDIQTSTRTFFAAGLATHNCYARPTHEYLGFSAGLDFETRILVKEDAPELLRRALSAPSWKPQVIALSGVTDPYQPVERRLGITRRCLEVLAEFRNPVGVVTKSRLVVRDIDLLSELARHNSAAVNISVTTLEPDLARLMEPRAAQPGSRLAAIEALARAGIPTGVLVAPVVPGLTDHEIPAILRAAASAGARFAGFVMLRLPHGVKDLFERWLDDHYPDRKSKVLSRVRAMRGGKLYDSTFGQRQRGSGLFAEQTAELFALACRRAGLATRGPELSTAAFRRPGGSQLDLFGPSSSWRARGGATRR